METKKEAGIDLLSLYGTWEDSRSSDEIINAIRKSRVEKNDLIDF
jgi:hypothetical protein